MDAIEVSSMTPRALEGQQFRDVMAATPGPVTVVTTMSEAGPVGCTVSAFMSLSLSPMLVAVALDKRSSVLGVIEATGTLGINVLAAPQAELALQFASSVPDRFAGVAWRRVGGLPRIHGTTGWLRCRVASVVDAGDHRLIVSEVLDVENSSQPPMVYAERLFGGHSKIQERPMASLARQLAACTY